MNNFTLTLRVSQSREEVFKAITNVRGWWSEDIEGNTEHLHDEFSYRFEDLHHCRIQLIDVVPGEKMLWMVKQNYFGFTKDKSEWTGTKISFDIEERDGRTELIFTHIGLVPEYECYDACVNGWTQYIQESLFNLITTGKGQPNAAGKPQTEDEKRLRTQQYEN